jgi:hypothetical protein
MRKTVTTVSIISNVSTEREKNSRSDKRKRERIPHTVLFTATLIRCQNNYTEILHPCNITCKNSFVSSTPAAWIECIETTIKHAFRQAGRQTDSRRNH